MADHYLKQELYKRVQTDPALFEFLQSGSLDGIWFWDITRPEEEWLSPEFKRLFGYEDHEIPNTSAWWQENIFPEDLSTALENFQKHVNDPTFPYDQIVRYRHKDGSTVWVRCRGLAIRDESGKAVRMLGVHTDVTALKEAEVRLRQSQRELKKKNAELTGFTTKLQQLGEIVNSSRNEIYIFRQDDLRFVYANDGAARNIGYEATELCELTPLDIKPDLTEEQLLATVAPLKDGLEDYLRFETRHKRKNGTLYNADIHLQITEYEGQECYVAIILDNTDLKHSIENLQQANDDLEQFAYIASHDLRSPLRAISNLARFLKEDEGEELSETSRRYLDQLEGRVIAMDTLLDDLLAYSRAGRHEGEQARVNVQELVGQVIDLLDLPDTFTVEVSSELSEFQTYVTPLRQVLQNLIGNAYKHHDKDSGRIEVTAKEEEAYYVFAVSDDGPGIAKQYHDKIFEIFQRLSPKEGVKGSGMGLALIRRFTKQYGGDIDVYSEEGKGATFVVKWPKVIIPF